MSLPNLLIVGAAKSGTTSLHNYLNQHPDIFMSNLKEPHFLINTDIGVSRIPKGIICKTIRHHSPDKPTNHHAS